MNYIFFDILIVAVLFLFLWKGWKRGLMYMLCGFLAFFVALAGAVLISNALAEPVARAIEPAVARGIHGALSKTIQHVPPVDGKLDVEGLLGEIPLDQAVAALKESALYQGIASAFQSAAEKGLADAAARTTAALAHYAAVQIARIVIFVVAFLAVLIAWKLVSRALDLVTRLPVLNGMNRFGGAAVSLVMGTLYMAAAIWLLKDSFLTPEMVENTYLLRIFSSLEPPSFFSLGNH